jgi:ankyrin repeat protein
MSNSDAAQHLGNTLLKDLAPYAPNSRKASNVDLQSIKVTIRSCGVVGAGVRNGDTLLHAFAESGNEVSMQLLLEMGARISTLNKSGYSALQLAVEKGHESVISLLLKHGATVDVHDSAQSPLFRAAILGQRGTVRLMLQHRKRSSFPAPVMLYNAALKGDFQILQILLENGAEDIRVSTATHSPFFKNPPPPARIRTALHEAVARGFPVFVIEMLANVDNIKTIDTRGKTPLHEAASGASIAVVETLLQKGADVLAIDFEGQTALHRAVCASPPSSAMATVKLLLEKGAKVDALNNCGSTPLHLTVFAEDSEPCPFVVELLLSKGASVCATEKLSKSALLDTAFRRTANSSTVLELLLDHGADIQGMLALGYHESEYISLLGSSAATKLLSKFASQRRFSHTSVTMGSQRTRFARINRVLSRNSTACTSKSLSLRIGKDGDSAVGGGMAFPVS